MKGLIWLIVIFCALYIIRTIIDIIMDICKGHRWSILRNEILEYLKTIGEAKVIGFEGNNIVESIDFHPSKQKNIDLTKLTQFSIDAKLCDRVFEWKVKDDNLIFMFTSI